MTDRKAIKVILLVMVTVFLLMFPFRDQGFTDDFAYAQSVRHFLEYRELQVSDWLAPTSIFPILWGSVFSIIFGFSFSVLHLSTVAMLPVLGVFTYFLLKEFRISSGRSLLATLFFLSIPWIFQFSYTFMSDIPFLSLEVLSLLFFCRGLRSGKLSETLLGSIFASLAFLTRQLGIVFPIATAVTWLFSPSSYSFRLKKNQALSALAIPLLTLGWYLWWLSLPGNKTATQIYYQQMFDINLDNVGLYFHRSLNYLSQTIGLFFPLLSLLFLSNLQTVASLIRKRWRPVLFIAVTILSLYAVDVATNYPGYTVGFPLILYEHEELFPIPWDHWWKYFVLLSVPMWATLAWISINKIQTNAYAVLMFLSFCGVFSLTLVALFDWEEYVIPLLPFTMLWVASTTKRWRTPPVASGLLLVLLLVDTLQMTKLRYDENGVAWAKAVELIEAGAPILEIDPNQNTAWKAWFYYEQLTQNNQPWLPGLYQKDDARSYVIASKRRQKRLGLEIQGEVIEEIPVDSLFVNSTLLLISR
jgi:4-amino-4-deoxy-L-arabinose transferase-like glycosyltransferase